MYQKLIVLAIAAVSLASCDKTQKKTPCGPQVCTDLFASIGLHFIDENNNPVNVTDFEVVDLRTNKAITHIVPPNYHPNGYIEVLDDNDIKDLSSTGDNVQVSATNPATNQTKTVNLKISGGCNCHVAKISGPDTVKFD